MTKLYLFHKSKHFYTINKYKPFCIVTKYYKIIQNRKTIKKFNFFIELDKCMSFNTENNVFNQAEVIRFIHKNLKNITFKKYL